MDDLRRVISDIGTTRSESVKQQGCGRGDPVRYPHSDWSDDVLEVLAHLGEGIGGVVHEVRDIRTGMKMARKAIVTREAPIKQLFREISIILTLSHENIVHFYGAYMSPSSSEVKVVMELGEGKSLDAIGERITRHKGRVGEKVAGRLAEGVRNLRYTLLYMTLTSYRFYRVSIIFIGRNLFIEILSHPISCCPEPALACYETLVCRESSSSRMPTHSRAQESTWL